MTVLPTSLEAVVESRYPASVKIIAISDHYLIYGVRKFQATKQSARIIEYRDFKQFNETHFLFELQSSINLNLEYWDPNDSWSVWKNTFLNIVNRHAPLKKRRVSSKRLPWITKDLITKKRQKAFLKKKAVLSGLEADWTIYKSAKNSYNRLVKCTIRQYYQDKLQTDTKDPKKMWKTINELMNNSKKDTKTFELTTDNNATASMFADDTQIETSSNDVSVMKHELNHDLENVSTWLSANKLTLNKMKTEYMIIGSNKRLKHSQIHLEPHIHIGESRIDRVKTTKSLGLMIDESLIWNAQVDKITGKVN